MFMCDTLTSSTQCYRLIWFKCGSNLYAQEHGFLCLHDTLSVWHEIHPSTELLKKETIGAVGS